ncbi:MAG: c-type cytochrome [Planctomycetales bacterium]|nr:c-type cytochrome [Planctomycetales bacterium]
MKRNNTPFEQLDQWKRILGNAVFASLLMLLGEGVLRAQQEVPDTPDKDYSSELPRIQPLSPEQALQSFGIADGFIVELVAAEPLVMDPVAFAFDSRHRMFVAEMRDYSEQETEHLGVIALLEDSDGNGTMDVRHDFVTGLSWPTGLWPWKDGVLVAHPPRLTWFRDTNDDGIADHSEVWFDGFGRSNVQGLINSLRWTVAGTISGATSSSGAQVMQAAIASDEPLQLGRRDFEIDPLTKKMSAVTGGGQHGLSFNRWGDRFVTSNSDHLQQVLDLETWLQSHSASVAIPALRRSIAEDGPQAEVYRSSPVEPWRIVRTRLRVSGVVPGIVEGGGRAAGYFTGASGTLILDAELRFGVTDFDTAIVCDVGSNLVHRKQMIDHGLYWSAKRIDDHSELLRSSDTWFRPVQIGDGPDGCLYIADMYREVIEHPKSLPPMLKQHLDLTSGRDKGRIYRLKHASVGNPASLILADLSSSELVENLANPISWQRLMSAQLLLERQPADVQASLEKLALHSSSPSARILALHLLQRLQHLRTPVLTQLLADGETDLRVAEHAIRLLSPRALSEPSLERILSKQDISQPRIQLSLMMLAADMPTDLRMATLGQLLPQIELPILRAILATAAGNDAARLAADKVDDMGPNAIGPWLTLFMPIWVRDSQSNSDSRTWIQQKLVGAAVSQSAEWLSAFSSLPQQAKDQLFDCLDEDQRQTTINRIAESIANSPPSIESTRWLRLVPESVQTTLAERLLNPETPQPVVVELIRLLDWSSNAELVDLLLARFTSLTPSVQQECLRTLARRQASLEKLVLALEAGVVPPSLIPPDTRHSLVGAANEGLANRSQNVFSEITEDRREITRRYQAEMQRLAKASLESVPSNEAAAQVSGREVFEKNCSQCHRLGGIGQDVGPPLGQLQQKTPQQLLEAILDPNREIDPKYTAYRILLSDGRALSGIVQQETAGQFILAEPGGRVYAINRSEVDVLSSTGQSIMPVGLEQAITPEQMANLIDYLRTAN